MIRTEYVRTRPKRNLTRPKTNHEINRKMLTLSKRNFLQRNEKTFYSTLEASSQPNDSFILNVIGFASTWLD